MPESNHRPSYLYNRDPEPAAFHFFPCTDEDEIDEMVWLFANVGLVTSATSEARVRRICEQKGVAFTATMQAACDQASNFH